jgi:hypothetical protein
MTIKTFAAIIVMIYTMDYSQEEIFKMEYNNCPRDSDIDNLDFKVRDIDFRLDRMEREFLDSRIDDLEEEIKSLLERIINLERDI